MRTLILSCNTGEGHNSCARAIRAVYAAHSVPCEITDALQFVSDGFSRLVSRGHSGMYRRAPHLIDRSYSFLERHPAAGHSADSLLALGREKLADFLRQGGYDTVICTHPFAATMLRDAPVDVRGAFVATDYTCSPTVKDCGADFCFIPAEDLRADFCGGTLSDERIFASGIPVAPDFFSAVPSPQAQPHLVMMGGSMGCGPMETLLTLLSADSRFDISVVCGNNAALHDRLSRRFPQSNIRVLGYIKDMADLLSTADLYLTKPGGLSSTEAAVLGVPMVFINAVGGCEEYNLRYFCERGGALAGQAAEDTAALCLSLLHEPALRESMSEALRALAIPNGAEQIFQTLCG